IDDWYQEICPSRCWADGLDRLGFNFNVHMTHRWLSSAVCIVCIWVCLSRGSLWAESRVLVVHVEDVQRHPVSGIQIGTEGDGGSAITGDDGKARIPLAKETRETSWVSLQILSS